MAFTASNPGDRLARCNAASALMHVFSDEDAATDDRIALLATTLSAKLVLGDDLDLTTLRHSAAALWRAAQHPRGRDAIINTGACACVSRVLLAFCDAGFSALGSEEDGLGVLVQLMEFFIGVAWSIAGAALVDELLSTGMVASMIQLVIQLPTTPEYGGLRTLSIKVLWTLSSQSEDVARMLVLERHVKGRTTTP